MGRGAVLATLVVLAYVGFEVVMVSKSKYRMAPDFILDEFVGAGEAAGRCGAPEEQRAAFDRNLVAVRRRAGEAAAEAAPALSPEEVELAVAAREAARREAIAALIDEAGCAAPKVQQQLKLHEIRSRLTIR